jgi:hypothetical protein
MTSNRLLYCNIEDYLGPAVTRFFGAGYRRARHQVENVVVTAKEVTASVTVRYPADWSRKADDLDLRPHLSTIDTLVLGAQLAEAYLAGAHGLDPSARRTMWLRRVTLRAGMIPQEDLTNLSATLRHKETSLDGVSVLDCSVGVMRIQLEIGHATGGAPVTGTYDTLSDVLGPAGERYYGTGFTQRRHILTDVDADTADWTATATVRAGDDVTGGAGIEGAYQPSVSMVDCFVVNLQLAQVLMYELDSLSRGESNTLWMMQTTLTAAQPPRTWPAALAARVAMQGSHLIPLRGRTWRNVDITGGLGGFSLRTSLAHELPERKS